jgi:hypothetical protein
MTSFLRANLKNTRLDKVQFFGVFATIPFEGLRNPTRVRVAELWLGWGELSLEDWADDPNLRRPLDRFHQEIRHAFNEAELSTAKLPDSLLGFLSGKVGARASANCKPRRHGQ